MTVVLMASYNKAGLNSPILQTQPEVDIAAFFYYYHHYKQRHELKNSLPWLEGLPEKLTRWTYIKGNTVYERLTNVS